MLAMAVNDNAGCLNARVIVNDHREHARSYSKDVIKGFAFPGPWPNQSSNLITLTIAR